MSNRVRYGQLDTNIMLDTFLNSTDECIVIVNEKAEIEVLSCAYATFLGVDRDAVIGKHVTEVIENTRMHIVLETGVAEFADRQFIKGSSMIAARIPIFLDGKVIGAFGRVLFKDMKDFTALYERIAAVENELSLYKKSFADSHRPEFSVDDIITENPAMIQLKRAIAQVSRTNSSVLILGESGTGKELVAHAVHKASQRSSKPFISLNCGAIPHDLLESELFGYEPGSFTGASKKGKIGMLSAANNGTIFLDEIGEMSVGLQVKLLRFLAEKEIKRIGSNVSEKVDVRIIAATNRDLGDMIATGTFRLDLYYRLSVVQLSIPALRERKNDIPVLTRHLIRKICQRENLQEPTITEEALQCLQYYDWPGNVRELENVLESAINFVGPEQTIELWNLPARLNSLGDLQKFVGPDFSNQTLKSAMDMVEKEIIINVLNQQNHNKSKVAESLGVSRTQLYEKMKKHGIPFTA